MKKLLKDLVAFATASTLLAILAVGTGPARAGSPSPEPCKCEITVPSGYSIIAIPCNDGTVPLSTLLSTVPNGSKLHRWIPGVALYQTNLFSGSTWSSPGTTFFSGEAAFLLQPAELSAGLKFHRSRSANDTGAATHFRLYIGR